MLDRIKILFNKIKNNKRKCITAAVILIILVAAFWYGGDTKDSKGFKITKRTEESNETKNNSEAEDEFNKLLSETTNDRTTSGAVSEIYSEDSNQNEKADNNMNASDSSNTSEVNNNNSSNVSDNAISNGNSINDSSNSDTANVNEYNSQGLQNQQITDKTEVNGNSENTNSAASNSNQQNSTGQQTQVNNTCTFSISCATILNNMSDLNKDVKDIIPGDGWILKPQTVEFKDGETVFEFTKRICKAKGIPMEFEETPLYNSAYIEGIYNIYEFDCGNRSGWMYCVNGVYNSYGSSNYTIKYGDDIKWVYTCNLGNDLK